MCAGGGKWNFAENRQPLKTDSLGSGAHQPGRCMLPQAKYRTRGCRYQYPWSMLPDASCDTARGESMFAAGSTAAAVTENFARVQAVITAVAAQRAGSGEAAPNFLANLPKCPSIGTYRRNIIMLRNVDRGNASTRGATCGVERGRCLPHLPGVTTVVPQPWQSLAPLLQR